MRLTLANLYIAAYLVLTCEAPVLADDWPQWMGPNRDSVWRETGIVDRFPKEGLTVKWRTPIAAGYSGPAVVGGKVFVTDYVRERGEVANSPDARNELQGHERVLCLDAATGSLIWKEQYRRPYRLSYAAGPRATPTVDNGKVYTLGAHGDLLCLDVERGAVIWRKDLEKEFKVETPLWGFCGHPLIDGDRLICLVGGPGSVVVAFDKHTGQEIWRALSAPEPGYCPPTMIEAGGTRQLLIWHPESINSLDPTTGELYWSHPLEPAFAMSITAPRMAGNYLYASAIGFIAALFRLDESSPGAEVVWRGDAKTGVFCSNSTPIIDEGVIYGVGCRKGELCAVRLKTGKRLWETLSFTSGARPANQGTVFLVKHEDRYFLFNEQGDLILAKLTAEGHQELGRFHVLEPTNEAFGRDVVWSHPAFADRCVFARNDKEVVCVSLAE
jgi:outer membrane protein assembly factor BamB